MIGLKLRTSTPANDARVVISLKNISSQVAPACSNFVMVSRHQTTATAKGRISANCGAANSAHPLAKHSAESTSIRARYFYLSKAGFPPPSYRTQDSLIAYSTAFKRPEAGLKPLVAQRR